MRYWISKYGKVLVAFFQVFVFLFFGSNGVAQINTGYAGSSSSLFYYYGAQRIPLSNSKKHFYVEGSSSAAVQSMAVGMQSIGPMSGAQLQLLATPTRGLLTLAGTDGIDSALAWLQQQPGVVVVRPAVFQAGSTDHLYEEAFYVKLKPTTTTMMLQNEAAKMGCVVVKPYAYDKRVYLLHAGPTAHFDGLQMANRFYESGFFEYAEPDFRGIDLLQSAPNDPLYPLQWALKNTGSAQQFNGTPGADIGIEQAWQITRGNPSIRIAVIDEGVERTHPDLVKNIDPMGYGLVPANANNGEVLGINQTHGTACAGIIAAEANNGIGIAGIAPLCKIIPVNLTINANGSFGSLIQIARTIDWSWNEGRADILSNSYVIFMESSLITDAIKRATTLGRGGKGAIVLFASGNYDAAVAFPAAVPEAIAVGGMSMCYQRKSTISCDSEIFWGANYGQGLDVVAPAVKIPTTGNQGSYLPDFNGTSSACPIAAGVAALILSVNPNYTLAQTREILERSARKVGNYTYRRVAEQPNGSWSYELGYGMVNAYQAVLAAQNFDFNCKVSIAATGATEFCAGGATGIAVSNPVSGATYTWLRNGASLTTGQNIIVSNSGLYQAVITRPGGCRDTSIGLQVRVAASLGTLQANAGRDTTVCVAQSFILGGSPSGTGGTPFHHPLRGMAHNYSNNQFFRFNPDNPVAQFRVVKENFSQSNNVFVGAAVTPRGTILLTDNGSLFRLDTATGQLRSFSSINTSFGFYGMTYNAVQQKIFAVGYNRSWGNALFEINVANGAATQLGIIANTSYFILVWLAADANGDLYAMRAGPNSIIQPARPSVIYKITGTPPTAVALPQGTGFAADFFQDADFDPITGKLLLFARSNPLGSNIGAFGGGLWEANTSTGVATLLGNVGLGAGRLDGLIFAGPEYRYQWSPAQYLSNPKDANPLFSGAPPGTYTYTLTVTDLCGQTAQSLVRIAVRPSLLPNANGVLFVNAAATGNGTGESWANAVPDLQQALLNLTNTCGTINQIWVARGTYKPTNGANRDISFTMHNNLAIYGGFAGDETELSQRNIRNNPTYLSGEIGNNATTTDNSYNVVRNDGNGLNNTARLDGFTITGGNANKGDYIGSRGAGIFNRGSSPTYTNCIVVGNQVTAFGGGMFSEAGSPRIINSVLAGNTAQFGAALFNSNATTLVVNCTISGNQTSNTTAAIYSMGTPAPTIRNSIIWGNSFGIQNAGGGSSNAVVTNSLVQGGYAPGTNIFTSNPFFVTQLSPGLGNLGNLHLQPCSPAINTGSNADLPAGFFTDVAGGTRIVNTTVDMGAYERQVLTQPSILYVNASAPGGGDGSNWMNAFTKLQDALEASRLCGSIRQIWVAKGTYYPDEGIGIANNNRNASFRLRDTLSIYGGFAGNETTLAQRNLALPNASILSGEIQQDGEQTNNTIQVVIAENFTKSVTLDGFTIQGGYTNIVLPEALSRGAGLLVSSCTQPMFRNITIAGNTAYRGAGITVINSNATFINCVIRNNHVLSGNGIILNDNSFARYFHCSVGGNTFGGTEPVVVRITGNTSPQIINTIIRGTSPAVSGGNPFIVYSNIQNATIWPGQNNSNTDPLFVNEAAGNLRLSLCSPLINSNGVLPDISTDILGLPRILGAGPDLGAYESAGSSILYVNAAATGKNDGSSWADAHTSLQDALSRSCPTAREVWVARGTYKPTNTTNRDAAFTMRNNLSILGGFAGNEVTSNFRDWQVNPTILSGDIGIIGNRTDNAYNVVSNNNNGLNNTAVIDGFIIRDGQANKNEYARQRGGGMYNFGSSPVVRNCIFVGNFSTWYGGAVFNEGAAATPTFINCVFTGNEAGWGGGIYNEVSQTRVINCTFSSNRVVNIGGGMYTVGAPVATMVNSIVWGNTNGVDRNPGSNTNPIQVTHSIVQGGYPGTGNLSSDPHFTIQAPIGLGQWGNLRLLNCSPAINAGDNASVPADVTIDVWRQTRILLGKVDMGAYENISSTAPSQIYVDPSATGLEDGTNWNNAYTSLQAAINALNRCTTGASPTLFIAAGTYTIAPSVQYILDRLNAQLIGGYLPGSGGVRNPISFPVIIKGEMRVLKNATIDGVRVINP